MWFAFHSVKLAQGANLNTSLFILEADDANKAFRLITEKTGVDTSDWNLSAMVAAGCSTCDLAVEYLYGKISASIFPHLSRMTKVQLVAVLYDLNTHKAVLNKIKMPDGSEGLVCCKCSQYFPHAVANQPNGTLVCFGCRIWT